MAKRTDDWARAAEVNKEMIAKDLNMMKERMDEFLLSTTTIVVCRKKTLLGRCWAFGKGEERDFPQLFVLRHNKYKHICGNRLQFTGAPIIYGAKSPSKSTL